MKLYLTILLLLSISSVNAQTKTDSSEANYSYAALIAQKMDPKKLLGIWESTDSIQHQIEFLFQADGFKLTTRPTDSGRHQFNTYSFYKNDTSSMVSDMAVISKWPPSYCHIKQIDENTIEVRYGNFGAPGSLIHYRRMQNRAAW